MKTRKREPEGGFLTWPDLGFGVRYWPTKGAEQHVIDFEVLEVFSELGEGRFEWMGPDDKGPNPVEDAHAAKVYCSGHLKWDGCMNMRFDEQEQCMLHFCGKDAAGNIGRLLERIYEQLGPLIPAGDRDLLGGSKR